MTESDFFDPRVGVEERLRRFAAAHNRRLEHSLGFGKDGNVFFTDANTAVKVFVSPEPFAREQACYLRLKEMNVREIFGHHVPQLVDADEANLVLEMTTVQEPFLLDFASAYLDWAPDFPPEVLEEWEQAKAEEFGVHWPKVLVVLEFLREHCGIFLTDVHPGNITFDELGP